MLLWWINEITFICCPIYPRHLGFEKPLMIKDIVMKYGRIQNIWTNIFEVSDVWANCNCHKEMWMNMEYLDIYSYVKEFDMQTFILLHIYPSNLFYCSSYWKFKLNLNLQQCKKFHLKFFDKTLISLSVFSYHDSVFLLKFSLWWMKDINNLALGLFLSTLI